MTASPIEWLQNPDGSKGKSWNPVRGCSRVSHGCDSCYAMRQAHRFAGEGGTYEGLTTLRKGKVDWSGEARFVPDMLDTPLRWRKPQRVFVNSMSDMFHHSVTFEQIAAVFGVMAACPQHTFMVLTKRPERAVEFFAWLDEQARGLPSLVGAQPSPAEFAQSGAVLMFADQAMGFRFSRNIDEKSVRLFVETTRRPWPLPNVHLGVSAENQATADERIPLLLKCPAAVRWVSAEPLLGPIAFTDVREKLLDGSERSKNALVANDSLFGEDALSRNRCSWVVVGGESGQGARPMNLEWMRSVVEQCKAAGTPVFCKQFGARPFEMGQGLLDDDDPDAVDVCPIRLKHKKGADLSEIPGDWPREYPRSEP